MTALAVISLLIWIYLLVLNGDFWRDGESLSPVRPAAFPSVVAVVPARDEAGAIAESVGSLLAQDYAGRFAVVVVDDASADGTGAIARALPGAGRLTVLDGAPCPPGWAGKLWAVDQGVAATDAEFLLLTDADIVHDPAHVAALVAKAEESGAELVSEMVALHCESVAERALVPAFVYFFAMLTPFAQVNDPTSPTAAAAGGTMLIRRSALERIGGISAISGELIDDIALARAVKQEGRIWLGHSQLARSLRRYPGFADFWRMVARSAYVQLRFSPLRLAATVLGMLLTFAIPPLAALFAEGWGAFLGLVAWAAMAASFVPTLARYGLPLLWAPFLPAIAMFYLAATLGSAFDHYAGRGVVWKGRAYPGGDR